MSGTLPKGITASIATSNVTSVGDQPAILANVALGNVIANVNMAQQNAVSNQQAMNQLQMTTLGKLVERMTSPQPQDAAALRATLGAEDVAMLKALVQMLKRR